MEIDKDDIERVYGFMFNSLVAMASMTLKTEDAEDVVQQTFLELVESPPKQHFAGDENVEKYIQTAVKNHIADMITSGHRRPITNRDDSIISSIDREGVSDWQDDNRAYED